MKNLIFYLTICSFIFTLACSSSDSGCGTLYYPVSVNFSTDQNSIGIEDTLKILITIEDSILENTNPVKDSSDENIEIAIAIQEFKTFNSNSVDRSPFTLYENAIDSFELEMLRGTLSDTLETHIPGRSSGFLSNTTKILRPERNSTQRIFELNLMPLVKDTFVIHFLGTRWLINSEDQKCTTFNTLKFESSSNADLTLVNTQFIELANNFEGDPMIDPETQFQDYHGGILLFVE